ncbi:hypothetical protein DMH17_10595 [Raoultella planticola]|nr:hypothetical protein [Raoultella planticola]
MAAPVKTIPAARWCFTCWRSLLFAVAESLHSTKLSSLYNAAQFTSASVWRCRLRGGRPPTLGTRRFRLYRQ